MTPRNRIAAVILFLLTAACGKKAAEPVQAAAKKPDPTALKVATAETRRLDQTIGVTGSLNADESMTVTSEVAGRIVTLRADFGQAVKKGDVLVELDKQEYQLQVDRSKAALAQTLARLGLNPGQEADQPTSTPGLRQAQAQMEDAKFKFESAAKLVKSGDISQERYTELEKAYRARQAAYEAARDEVRMLWASMESAKADLKLAQKRLNDTVLRAPFDGGVQEKHFSAGQYVKENVPILTLVKANPMRLRLDIPENAAGSVKIGDTLLFTTDAAPGAEFKAVVRELNPSLDARSRSLTAEARLTSSDARLRPGMFVQVQLVIARDVPVIMVPKQAIYTLAGLNKVFVVRNGKAVECRIPPGREINGWVEVPESLIHSGDSVAVEKTGYLTDGAEVEVKKG